MKRFFLLAAVFMTVGLSVYYAQASKNQNVEFYLPEAALWNRVYDDEELGIDGDYQYYFSDTDDIDLNILRIDDDLADSVQKRGADQFVQDYMSGKKFANDLFGAGESELLNYNLSQAVDHQILEIHCRQAYDDGRIETIERIFLYPGYAVQTHLRWRLTANPEKLKQAQKLFADFRVDSLPSVRK